eukprot:TRINITY_DN4091_c0_g3_i1.p1 TRINITY_DN4091_c0_g3~~TRINITY_DN4091_c0_g3_i1.p1  ORF type:complete len:390 (+),score=155.97 TRINITY_DN4091_c0_g3_i1:158-1327(+)
MPETWTVVFVVLACAAFACAVCLVVARRQRAQALSEIDSVEGLLGPKAKEMFPRGATLQYQGYVGHFMATYFKVPEAKDRQGKALANYTVYDIKLRGLGNHFDGKQAQPWDRQSRLAQHNFGDGKSAQLLRSAIRAENAQLMGGKSRGAVRYIAGEINTLSKFFSLIRAQGCGTKEANRPTFFCFVLLNNGLWRFGPATQYTLSKGLLKHAVLSDAASDVTFAGEFHFDQQTTSLVVDNFSETYNVDRNDLPKFAALLEANLPGITVDTVEKDDIQLAAKREGSAAQQQMASRNPSFNKSEHSDAHGYKPPATDAAGLRASNQALSKFNNRTEEVETDEARLLRELDEATQKPPTPPPPHPNMVAIAEKDDQTRLLAELEEQMELDDST